MECLGNNFLSFYNKFIHCYVLLVFNKICMSLLLIIVKTLWKALNRRKSNLTKFCVARGGAFKVVLYF